LLTYLFKTEHHIYRAAREFGELNTTLLTKRFDELHDQFDQLLSTKNFKTFTGMGADGDYIDADLYLNWKTKVKNLLERACGEQSIHYTTFVNVKGSYETNLTVAFRHKAVFDAAREDYVGGYCNTIRNLVQAEVFSSELDQASELINAGYLSAAAVVAGVVLETTLRGLCDCLGLPTGKLDKMNADLAKVGHYNLLVQKRITALAQIRNDAAHGNPDKFTKDDVRDMIAYIAGFVSNQL
jgi:hypothetical protein